MKLALITGGHKRIGASIAGRLAREGWALALHCRAAADPDHDLAALLAIEGTRWHSFGADLAQPETAGALMAEVIAHFGTPPTLLVNNASRFVQDEWSDMDAEGLADRMNVNFASPVLLTLALAQANGKRSGTSVVNILDQRIRQPNGDQLSYTLAKQALAAATETLARVLAPQIRVNAVAPGLTIPTGDYKPAQMVALQKRMPLQNLPEPDDIADAVLWLAEAKATTGQTIFVDSGASLKSFDRDFMYLDES
jgi:pteridine reductase